MKAALKPSLVAAFFAVGLARASDAPPPSLHLIDIFRSCVSNSLQGGVRTSLQWDKGKNDSTSTHDLFVFPETAGQAATKIELHYFGTSRKDVSYGYYRIESRAGSDQDGVLRDHKYDFRIHGRQIEFMKPGDKDRAFSMTLSSTEENFNKVTKTTYDAAERTGLCMASGLHTQPLAP
ncbi:MAG TPA: hypothetical protein VFS88_01385 [Micavibrio sp.]|nr:hypothetical protein [Micavibrio sp.]